MAGTHAISKINILRNALGSSERICFICVSLVY